jgi:hypothetical protein
MDIRNSAEYQAMNAFNAVMIIESEDCPNECEELAAWQYLFDVGAYTWLQGFYGRRMQELLDNGIINRKEAE